MCESVDTSNYRCAITQMIFKNPVKCKTNIDDKHPITYENTAIIKWLAENDDSCPIKRKPIAIIEEDLEMKTNVEKLIKDNPELLSEQFVEEITGDSQKLNQLLVGLATVPIIMRSFGTVFPSLNESSFETFGTSRRIDTHLTPVLNLPNSLELLYSRYGLNTVH